MEQLCKELKNTLVSVTADHGHIDSRGVALTDYPNIMECLVRMPSIEPRALNFFVKEEKRQQQKKQMSKLATAATISLIVIVCVSLVFIAARSLGNVTFTKMVDYIKDR